MPPRICDLLTLWSIPPTLLDDWPLSRCRSWPACWLPYSWHAAVFKFSHLPLFVLSSQTNHPHTVQLLNQHPQPSRVNCLRTTFPPSHDPEQDGCACAELLPMPKHDCTPKPSLGSVSPGLKLQAAYSGRLLGHRLGCLFYGPRFVWSTLLAS